MIYYGSKSEIFFNLDSVGLCLVTCEFLLFSEVNFETSGLVLSNIGNMSIEGGLRSLTPIDDKIIYEKSHKKQI